MRTATLALLVLGLCGPAFAGSASVVLTGVEHMSSVQVDFGAEFQNISSVEITLTSVMGEVSVCWEELDGSIQSFACGNLTQLRLGNAFMQFDGLGEIDHRSFGEWYYVGSGWDTPVTDWSFLESGKTFVSIECFTDGCSADWLHGQGYCGPSVFDIQELVITVSADAVPNNAASWGALKALFK